MVNFSDGAFGAACPSVPKRKSKGGAGGAGGFEGAALRCAEVVVAVRVARRQALRRKEFAARRRRCPSATSALPGGIMRPRGTAGREAVAAMRVVSLASNNTEEGRG